MKRQITTDLMALMRSARLSIGLPGTLMSARRHAMEFVGAFERVVSPAVDDCVKDPEARRHVHAALMAVSTKLSFLIAGYAAMAGVPFLVELSVLGSSLARVYDDLIDEIGGEHLDDRLAVLFGGGTFVPASDMERLLLTLYRAADARLGRSRDDPVYAALIDLHRCQTLSRQQKDPAISDAALDEITLGKGGYGVVVLFALMRPSMGTQERQLIGELGGALQLLDDYQDFELDRQSEICTAATRRRLGLSHITSRLLRLRADLARFYGRRQAQEFLAVVYATLWISFLRRRQPQLGTRARSHRGGATSPLGVLVIPGDNMVQKAAQRRRRSPG